MPKLRFAICATCDGPIYLEVCELQTSLPRLAMQRLLQAAIRTHVDTHPESVLARYRACTWAHQDIRACYTIDEGLGSAAAYGLWLELHRCLDATCRHAQ